MAFLIVFGAFQLLAQDSNDSNNKDIREEVIRNEYPFTSICHLFFKVGRKTLRHTGFMVSDKVIITSASALHRPKISIGKKVRMGKKKVGDITIYVGGLFECGNFCTYTHRLELEYDDYTYKVSPNFNTKSPENNYAYIVLKDTLLSSGYLATKKFEDRLISDTVYLTSYPEDLHKEKEHSMWSRGALIDKTSSNDVLFDHSLHALSSEAGAPIWIKSDSANYVIGIQSGIDNKGIKFNDEFLKLVAEQIPNPDDESYIDNSVPKKEVNTNSDGNHGSQTDKAPKPKKATNSLSQLDKEDDLKDSKTIDDYFDEIKFDLIDTLNLSKSKVHGISGIEYEGEFEEWNNRYLPFTIVTDSIFLDGRDKASWLGELYLRFNNENGRISLEAKDSIPLNILDEIEGESLRIDKSGYMYIASEEDDEFKVFKGKSIKDLNEFQFKRENYKPIPNKGIEGIALNNKRDIVYIASEYPPIGEKNAIIWEVSEFGTRTFKYELFTKDGCKDKMSGISEILHYKEEVLFVLERQHCNKDNTIHKFYAVDLSKPDNLNKLVKSEIKLADEIVKVLRSDNFEGMTWGPLIGESKTLIFVSDDNYDPNEESTQQNIVLLVQEADKE